MTDGPTARAAVMAGPEPLRPLVLVVEDEEPIRRFLRATLESNHCRVKEAATAREGALLAA